MYSKRNNYSYIVLQTRLFLITSYVIEYARKTRYQHHDVSIKLHYRVTGARQPTSFYNPHRLLLALSSQYRSAKTA